MPEDKLYLGTNGRYYNEFEMHTAYFLATGDNVDAEENSVNHYKRFELWVHDLIGLSLQKIVDASEVSYEDFLASNQKLSAVRAYRERNNCTLREAKERIDDLAASLTKKGEEE